MRMVYDDAMQGKMVATVAWFMDVLDVRRIVEPEYGMDRVQMGKLKRLMNQYFSTQDLRIGDTVTHKNGIGNNCLYPVYYEPPGATEIQQCGSINLNTGMFGEGYVSCENYNGTRISPIYKVRARSITRMAGCETELNYHVRVH